MKPQSPFSIVIEVLKVFVGQRSTKLWFIKVEDLKKVYATSTNAVAAQEARVRHYNYPQSLTSQRFAAL